MPLHPAQQVEGERVVLEVTLRRRQSQKKLEARLLKLHIPEMLKQDPGRVSAVLAH
jgi:hypothetical protein